MIRYDMAKLASSVRVHRPGTKALLPVIAAGLGAEVAYLKVLRTMLRQIAAAVREDVLPVVARELAAEAAAKRIVHDVDSATFERIKQLGQSLGIIASDAINRILGLEGQRHTKTFMQTAKRALGIDLTAVVRLEDLESYLETAATRNAGLIKGLSDLAVQRVQTTVTNFVLQGKTATELKKQLVADFGFADSRAKLIARDQIAKLNSDMNRIRQQQAGISEYIWRTSHDERVRPRHKKCDGITYKFGQPTAAEQGLPPGQPIQCRCIAQAVVDFGEDAKTPTPVTRSAPTPEPAPVKATEGGRLTDDETRAIMPDLFEKYSFIDDAPDEQRNALRFYLRNSFSKFIEGIRNGKMDQPTVDRTRALNELLEKRKLTELPYLYRGLKSAEVNLESNDPFTSTAVTLSKAATWAGKDGAVLEIKKPKAGFTGFLAERYWNSAKAIANRKKDPLIGEGEFLLKGARFEKIGERTVNGLRIITVSVKE